MDSAGPPGTKMTELSQSAPDTLFTLFHCDRVQDIHVCINNTIMNGFALSLCSSSGVIAGMALAEQKADTSMRQDTFLIATTNPDNIT